MTTLRYGAYHRISRLNGRDLEDETTITDKDAFERIDGWAASKGLAKPERYLDADVSGSKMSRPELDRMLDDLRAGRIDGIAVAQVDRLSRASVADALKVVAEVTDIAPQGLVILDLGIDPTTEFGEFGLTILLALARMQWRRYKRQWTTAQTRALARGAWIGPDPLGYRKAVIGHTKKGKPIYGPLEPDDDTGPIITRAFDIAAGDGLHAACAYLAEQVPERRWRTSDARRILSMPVYLGEVVYGTLPPVKAHPPLTTLATWETAQTEPHGRRTNGNYPLSGIATCQCGAAMVGALQTVREKTYRRYRCSSPGCRGGSSIGADRLEGYVRDVVRAELERHGAGAFAALTHGEVHAAERALAEAEAERTSFARDVAFLRALGPEAARANAEALGAVVEQARETYQALASQATRAAQVPASSELDDPVKLLRAVAAGVESIAVRPGRGSVEDRVRIRFHDLDDAAGVFAT
jgi:site-specific DNA recombinase